MKETCRKVHLSWYTVDLTLVKNIDWNNWEYVIHNHFIVFRPENFTQKQLDEFEAQKVEYTFKLLHSVKGGTGQNPNFRSKNFVERMIIEDYTV